MSDDETYVRFFLCAKSVQLFKHPLLLLLLLLLLLPQVQGDIATSTTTEMRLPPRCCF
jgi:hypothetical protein